MAFACTYAESNETGKWRPTPNKFYPANSFAWTTVRRNAQGYSVCTPATTTTTTTNIGQLARGQCKHGMCASRSRTLSLLPSFRSSLSPRSTSPTTALIPLPPSTATSTRGPTWRVRSRSPSRSSSERIQHHLGVAKLTPVTAAPNTPPLLPPALPLPTPCAVQTMGAQNSTDRTADQTQAASFWNKQPEYVWFDAVEQVRRRGTTGRDGGVLLAAAVGSCGCGVVVMARTYVSLFGPPCPCPPSA